MFIFLLAALIAAAAVHVYRLEDRSLRRVGEIALLYLLVGYCGLPMLAMSIAVIVWPDQMAAHLGFPPGNPFQSFVGVSFLSMSLVSVLALRYRSAYLIAPSVCWAVFFAGATFIHIADYGSRGALDHGSALAIFATHGLISVLLVAALLSSGLLKGRSDPAAANR